ncbi:MAG: glycosyltransferase [Actinomycetota bacterium]|nr:glycosyltransferase [Actinomycetota bacterium]
MVATPAPSGTPDGSRPLVVWCATTPWNGLRLLDQSMSVALSRYADVLYVEPPISYLTRFRNPEAAAASGERGMTQVADGLWRLSVRVPPLRHRPPFEQIVLWSTRRALGRGVRQLGRRRPRALIVPGLSPVFGSTNEEVSVLYCKDDYVAGADLMGVQKWSARLLQRSVELPERADVVVAVSPLIQESVRAQGAEPILIPNGVDIEHFAEVPAPAPSRSPVVAFVGQLSARVNVDMLVAVAEAGVRLRMIGPTQVTLPAGHFERLTSLGDRVEWAGRVAYEELPGQLADVTTCLVPYADTRFNRASFPLKILEYLAAGRRVVSTPLPAVDWLDTDLVTSATTPTGFARAVAASVTTPLGGDEIGRRRMFAQGHTWERRAEVLAQALALSGAAEEALPVVGSA